METYVYPSSCFSGTWYFFLTHNFLSTCRATVVVLASLPMSFANSAGFSVSYWWISYFFFFVALQAPRTTKTGISAKWYATIFFLAGCTGLINRWLKAVRNSTGSASLTITLRVTRLWCLPMDIGKVADLAAVGLSIEEHYVCGIKYKRVYCRKLWSRTSFLMSVGPAPVLKAETTGVDTESSVPLRRISCSFYF